MYEFAAIIGQGEQHANQALLPRVLADGRIELEPGEKILAHAIAHSLRLYRGDSTVANRYLQLRKATIEVVVTSTRFLVLCRKFEKGNTWWGNPLLAIPATIVSRARVAILRHGKVLAGQMRLRWVHEVACATKQGWLSTNWLSLTAHDESRTAVVVRLKFGKSTSPRPLAEHITNAACTIHLSESDRLNTTQLSNLGRGLRLPTPEPGTAATLVIPGAQLASASNAYPAQTVPQ
jgi:hypothetical protein